MKTFNIPNSKDLKVKNSLLSKPIPKRKNINKVIHPIKHIKPLVKLYGWLLKFL